MGELDIIGESKNGISWENLRMEELDIMGESKNGRMGAHGIGGN